MPAALPVRRLHPADVAEYRAIRLATLRTEPAFFGSSYATEASRPVAEFAAVLATPAVFGAYDGAAVVGTVRFRQADGAKEAHKGGVHGFFVQPAWRHRGVGSALMAALIATARDTVEHLTLSVVRENTAAIALYERFGFRTYGIEPRARKHADGYQDMVLMALSRMDRDPWGG